MQISFLFPLKYFHEFEEINFFVFIATSHSDIINVDSRQIVERKEKLLNELYISYVEIHTPSLYLLRESFCYLVGMSRKQVI